MTDPDAHLDDRAAPTIDPQKSGGGPFRSRPWLLPTVTGVSGFILGALVIGGAFSIASLVGLSSQVAAESAEQGARQVVLSEALNACGLPNDVNTELGDNGYSLTVNSRGEDDSEGLAYTDYFCLVNALEAPKSVTAHMEQTTSQDGRQTETWGNITASWSYHPDRGIDSVFTVKG